MLVSALWPNIIRLLAQSTLWWCVIFVCRRLEQMFIPCTLSNLIGRLNNVVSFFFSSRFKFYKAIPTTKSVMVTSIHDRTDVILHSYIYIYTRILMRTDRQIHAKQFLFLRNFKAITSEFLLRCQTMNCTTSRAAVDIEMKNMWRSWFH